MARPSKQPGEHRDQRFNLRFTAEELAHLRAQAQRAGLAPHEYARRLVLGHRVSPAPRQADASLVSELNRIGVNVNQLARSENADRRFRGDWQALLAELRHVLGKVANSYGA